MAKNYRSVVNNAITEIEDVLDNIEANIVDIQDILKTICEEDVSNEVNSKIGDIEECIDSMLYELKY